MAIVKMYISEKDRHIDLETKLQDDRRRLQQLNCDLPAIDR